MKLPKLITRPGTLAVLTVTFALILFASRADAASVASDNSGNSAYNGGWANGNNGGSGWNGGWAISTGSGSTTFTASSPNIDTSGRSWGEFAASGTSADASRYFNGGLSNSQCFVIDYEINSVNSSGGVCGFDLRAGGDSDSKNRFRFQFVGGGSFFQIVDNSNSGNGYNTAVGYTSGGLRVIVQITGADTYKLTVLQPNTGTVVYTNSGTLNEQSGGVTGMACDRVHCWAFNNPGNSANNVYFNSIGITYDAPGISAQPVASTNGTYGSTTPAITVGAGSTDGSTLSYAWRKRGSGWGTSWTMDVNSGNIFLASSGQIDSGSGNSWGLQQAGTGNPATDAIRPLPATLAANQTLSIDFDNKGINNSSQNGGTAGVVGISLQDGSGNNAFEFYFSGGGSNYSINDTSSGARNTGMPYTSTGLHLDFTLTSSTNYSVKIKRLSDGATVILTGSVLNTRSIQRVRFFAFGSGGGNNVYFNNLVVEGADDNAGDYTTWSGTTHPDNGQKALSDAASGNGGTYSGTATASFTITTPGLNDSGNYDCAVMSGQGYTTISSASALTVNTLAVQLTGSRNYDGTATAAAGILSVANKVGSDTVTVGGTSATLAGRNIGTENIIATNGLTLSGAQAGNYTLTNATGSVTIGKTNLAVTAATNTKNYDGTTSAAAAPTITTGGIQTGDTAPTWTETYDTRNQGSGKTLTPASLVVSDGNSGNNYNYTYVTVSTGVINKTNLTVTAAANTKNYNGTTSAAATPTITAGSIQSGDNAPAWTETYDTRNQGSGKTLTPASLVVSDGNSGNNYNYTYATVSTGVINKTNITVTAVANTKGYDGNTSAAATPTIGPGSVQSGDTANFIETYDNKNAGTGKTMTPGGTVSDGNSGNNYNYSFVTSANGAITQAVTSVSLASSENPSGFKDGVIFTAALPSDATGVVVFKTNSVLYDTEGLHSGSTTTTNSTLPRMVNTVTAEYAGDGNYFGSTNSIAQTVTNHPPVAALMTVQRTAGLRLMIALSDIATNWTDTDGDPVSLTAINLVTTNNVNLMLLNTTTNNNGSYVITNTAFIGYTNSPNVNDQFTYSISDGQGGTNMGIVNIAIVSSVTGTNSIVSISGGNPTTVTAYGVPGYFYVTQRATNLAPAVWVNISTNLAATNGTVGRIIVIDNFTDLGGTPPSSAFYRLSWSP